MNPLLFKSCSCCGEYKTPNDFNKNKTTCDGLSCSCRHCLKTNQKNKYQNDLTYRKKAINAGKSFYKENKEKIKRAGKKDAPQTILKQRISEIFKRPCLQFCDTIGCSGVEFRKYIVSKLEAEMTPRDINKTWKFDFLIPLDSFDFTKMEERRRAFHYSNIYPKWKKEISKPHS